MIGGPCVKSPYSIYRGDAEKCCNARHLENRPRVHLLDLPRHARGAGGAGQAGLPAAAQALRGAGCRLGRGGPALGRHRRSRPPKARSCPSAWPKSSAAGPTSSACWASATAGCRGKIAEELIEPQPWLAEHREKSVTELEILHGVLNNPKMAEPGLLLLPRPGLHRADSSAAAGATSSKQTRCAGRKLDALKRAHSRQRRGVVATTIPIRRRSASGCSKTSRSPSTDCTRSSRPPARWSATRPSTRPLPAAGPWLRWPGVFRASTSAGRSTSTGSTHHAAGDGPPLVVLGESGSGKSALLANWALRYRADAPGRARAPALHRRHARQRRLGGHAAADHGRAQAAFRHRAGDSRQARRPAGGLCQLACTWRRRKGGSCWSSTPSTSSKIATAPRTWSGCRPVIPANVRLVLSTLPGRPLDELRKRALARAHGRAAGAGGARGVDRPSTWPSTPSTLTRPRSSGSPARRRQPTRSTCGRCWTNCDLRGRTSAWTSGSTITWAPNDVAELYARILARWEADYERDRPCLVRDATTAPVGGPPRPVRVRATGTPRHGRPAVAARPLVAALPWRPTNR